MAASAVRGHVSIVCPVSADYFWEATASEHAAAEQVMRTAEADGKAVLDPLRALEAVLDRRTLRRRLPDLQESTSDLVVWSECLTVQDRRAAEAKAGAMRSMLEGCDGLLCKPCVACGIPESHEMCLVRHPAALPPDVRHPPALPVPPPSSCGGLQSLWTAAVTQAAWCGPLPSQSWAACAPVTLGLCQCWHPGFTRLLRPPVLP